MPARTLAAELGSRVGSAAQAFGTALAPFVRVTRALRAFARAGGVGAHRSPPRPCAVTSPPSIRTARGRCSTKNGLLYADDPSFSDDDRLWGDMLRTGARRAHRRPARQGVPLELDDLVLSIQGVATVGLSVEQIEQLARAGEPLSASGERSVVVLRQGDGGPHELVVAPPPDDAAEDAGTASPTHEDPETRRTTKWRSSSMCRTVAAASGDRHDPLRGR